MVRAQPQDLTGTDLGVPERRAVFAVAVDRAEERIDVHQRQLLQTGQPIGVGLEGEQVPAEYRAQFAGHGRG